MTGGHAVPGRPIPGSFSRIISAKYADRGDLCTRPRSQRLQDCQTGQFFTRTFSTRSSCSGSSHTHDLLLHIASVIERYGRRCWLRQDLPDDLQPDLAHTGSERRAVPGGKTPFGGSLLLIFSRKGIQQECRPPKTPFPVDGRGIRYHPAQPHSSIGRSDRGRTAPALPRGPEACVKIKPLSI
jgi:hypothetical protein